MPSSGESEEPNANSARPFLCGVVEVRPKILGLKRANYLTDTLDQGFYGRPWTLSQRRDLFEKMEAWGMTSYLYAPKDDCKHRAFWRELYTVNEQW